ncbi:uncharacterized protein C6orf136 homolog isoform X2 [Varanus komodoensis]|uniref:uncharacterized protein C6orf136 homolog isoform X2 n=1 Tax=Varanus komodoensis TaxID=61221 RepID=UPI001CF79C7C|nr:uncharacterized protein C6orf136 homolog isoform X2 [Varanus komodoensis]
MYRRSRAVARHLASRCPWRWEGSGSLRLGQGEAARCCHRVRPRELDASSDKLPPGLVPSASIGPTFHYLFAKKLLEAASTLPALSVPAGSNLAVSSPAELTTRRHLPTCAPETRALSPPAALSLLEGMDDAVTLVNGRQEDDIVVRESEGLDGASLDSLHSLFHGWQYRSPYQAPEVAVGPLAPFQATTGALSPVSSPDSKDPSMEEHLAVMHQKLREELPYFFVKAHNYEKYSQDVEFINEILHLRTRGKLMYQVSLSLCRFVAWNYFAVLNMEVLNVTQHPENWSIQARWRITGLPFHVLLFRFYKKDKSEFYRTYDAYSTFFLNSQGLINCHKVSKLMPSQPLLNKQQKLVVASLLGLELADERPPLLLFLAGKQQETPVSCRDH